MAEAGPLPPGACPFGGGHTVRWWHNHLGVACYRCHQTWVAKQFHGLWVFQATWPRAKEELGL